MPVPVSRYSYSLFVLVFVINRSFILFIVRLFVLFSFSLMLACFIVVQKREKNNSDPEPCSGISIPCYLFQHHHLVNKHHTADSTDFVLV